MIAYATPVAYAGLFWLACCTFFLGLIVWDLHGWRVREFFGDPPISAEDTAKIMHAVEVSEPLSKEEVDELDDFMEFEDDSEVPGAVELAVTTLILYAEYNQKPDDELWAA